MTLLPIPIPEGFDIKVKIGEKIKEEQVLASGNNSSEFQVNIGELLGTDPKNTKKLLKKNPGDRVEIGTLLAKKGGVLGSKEINSSVNGTIVKYNEETSDLFIKTDGEKAEDILSPVDGEVTVCDNNKIVIKCDKNAFVGKRSLGKEAVGEIFLIENKEADIFLLDTKVSGKIVIAQKFTREAVSKAFGLSALGIISGEFDDNDFENLKSHNIKNPVIEVEGDIFNKISKLDGKILIDGEKNIIIKL